MSQTEIAKTIGVNKSTVSRELKRNSDGRGHHKYNHDLAQRKADGRIASIQNILARSRAIVRNITFIFPINSTIVQIIWHSVSRESRSAHGKS